MLTLTRDDVRLGCRAADWRAALDQAAAALVEAGRVSGEYREGLLAREAQSSTYLGNGIAIPHGTPESRRHVRSTGVRVLQFMVKDIEEFRALALRQPTAAAVREALEAA
jgi:mannitol/fructose-specific phosphotransferase system IIA component